MWEVRQIWFDDDRGKAEIQELLEKGWEPFSTETHQPTMHQAVDSLTRPVGQPTPLGGGTYL